MSGLGQKDCWKATTDPRDRESGPKMEGDDSCRLRRVPCNRTGHRKSGMDSIGRHARQRHEIRHAERNRAGGNSSVLADCFVIQAPALNAP